MTPPAGAWVAAGGVTPEGAVGEGLTPGVEGAGEGMVPGCAGVAFEASEAPGIPGAGFAASVVAPAGPEAVLTTAAGLFSVLTEVLFFGIPES